MKLLTSVCLIVFFSVTYCQQEAEELVEARKVQEAFILAAGISGGVIIEPNVKDFDFPLPPEARAIVALNWHMTGTEIWLELPNPAQKPKEVVIDDYISFINSDDWHRTEDIWCKNGNALVGISYQAEGFPDDIYASYAGPYHDYPDEYKTIISIRMNSWPGMSFCQSQKN